MSDNDEKLPCLHQVTKKYFQLAMKNKGLGLCMVHSTELQFEWHTNKQTKNATVLIQKMIWMQNLGILKPIIDLHPF